ALLLGHSGNVCALDVSEDGTIIVSGSWDGEARVWAAGKWDTAAVLRGHEGSVWTVLALDNETIVTGVCAQASRVTSVHDIRLTRVRLRGQAHPRVSRFRQAHSTDPRQ
ncbi:MAG: hypothetical protein INR71_02340, partial [Terriglobus roseus]|nr:hypothetical protein [Terriglobus roseus]